MKPLFDCFCVVALSFAVANLAFAIFYLKDGERGRGLRVLTTALSGAAQLALLAFGAYCLAALRIKGLDLIPTAAILALLDVLALIINKICEKHARRTASD